MVSYKERKENTRVFVLIQNGIVLGCYGNLKKLCESVDDPSFPSYWTLARIKDKEHMEIENYSIQRVRLY